MEQNMKIKKLKDNKPLPIVNKGPKINVAAYAD